MSLPVIERVHSERRSEIDVVTSQGRCNSCGYVDRTAEPREYARAEDIKKRNHHAFCVRTTFIAMVDLGKELQRFFMYSANA